MFFHRFQHYFIRFLLLIFLYPVNVLFPSYFCRENVEADVNLQTAKVSEQSGKTRHVYHVIFSIRSDRMLLLWNQYIQISEGNDRKYMMF